MFIFSWKWEKRIQNDCSIVHMQFYHWNSRQKCMKNNYFEQIIMKKTKKKFERHLQIEKFNIVRYADLWRILVNYISIVILCVYIVFPLCMCCMHNQMYLFVVVAAVARCLILHAFGPHPLLTLNRINFLFLLNFTIIGYDHGHLCWNQLKHRIITIVIVIVFWMFKTCYFPI